MDNFRTWWGGTSKRTNEGLADDLEGVRRQPRDLRGCGGRSMSRTYCDNNGQLHVDRRAGLHLDDSALNVVELCL